MVDENDEGNSLPVCPLPRIQGETKKGAKKAGSFNPLIITSCSVYCVIFIHIVARYRGPALVSVSTLVESPWLPGDAHLVLAVSSHSSVIYLFIYLSLPTRMFDIFFNPLSSLGS